MLPYWLMPLPELGRATGLGKTAVYERLNSESQSYDPTFPKPVVLSPRCVRWRSDEVKAWLDARSANREANHAERQEQARKAGKARAKRKASAVELAGQA